MNLSPQKNSHVNQMRTNGNKRNLNYCFCDSQSNRAKFKIPKELKKFEINSKEGAIFAISICIMIPLDYYLTYSFSVQKSDGFIDLSI